jgi:phytanoyl-CoA hydroxylase
MLDAEQVARFNDQGFVLGTRVLDDEQVEALRCDLHRVIEDKDDPSKPQPVRVANLSGEAGTPVWQIVNIWQASEAYRELTHHPTIVEEVAQLTGAVELRVWHDQVQYKPAETGGVNRWHQDAPLWDLIGPDVQVTAWVALDDVDQGNGCMSMVPGSQRWGDQMKWISASVDGFDDLPTQFEDQPVTTKLCPVLKGHVHYHHSLTWHASHQNTSGRPRRAIAIHYMPQSTCYRAAGTHIMKPFAAVDDGEMLQGAGFPMVWPICSAT